MVLKAYADAVRYWYRHLFAGIGSKAEVPMFLFLLDVCLEIRKAGGKTPQFSWWNTFPDERGGEAVDLAYKDIYSKEKYKDLWFKWEGKPLMLAPKEHVKDGSQKSFFTYRDVHFEYTPVNRPNAWPWLSISPIKAAYTATNSKEAVAVGPGQNWAGNGPWTFFSAIDNLGNYIARDAATATARSRS